MEKRGKSSFPSPHGCSVGPSALSKPLLQGLTKDSIFSASVPLSLDRSGPLEFVPVRRVLPRARLLHDSSSSPPTDALSRGRRPARPLFGNVIRECYYFLSLLGSSSRLFVFVFELFSNCFRIQILFSSTKSHKAIFIKIKCPVLPSSASQTSMTLVPNCHTSSSPFPFCRKTR